MLATQSLTDVLDAFSSSAPTPGGGSAAALAGALGASLLAMVAALPKTKNNTPEERAALDAARATILRLRSQLVELIDRDAAAYDAVVAAYRLPKGTDEEKAVRKTAIQDALKLATDVPLETCLAVNDVAREAGAVAGGGQSVGEERSSPSRFSSWGRPGRARSSTSKRTSAASPIRHSSPRSSAGSRSLTGRPAPS